MECNQKSRNEKERVDGKECTVYIGSIILLDVLKKNSVNIVVSLSIYVQTYNVTFF